MDRVNIDLVDVDADRELGGDRKVITAFEIQVLNHGDWQIDSIFDDQDLATFEANLVFGRGAYDAVRVVQEN